ncbi:hypothetical protein M0805_008545 [Coniferiporia weirii]|nr:hypothetical protein M0805_008545 [Coniferiporia weirii]
MSFHNLTVTSPLSEGQPIGPQGNAGHFVACVVIILAGMQYLNARKRDIAVPAIGPPGRLASYFGAIKFMKNARALLLEGYKNYNSRTFKVPQLGRWLVIVSSPELIDEVRKAPDNKLSFSEAIEDTLFQKYTLGHLAKEGHRNISVVRSQLTRNIANLFDDIKDEIACAFDDGIPVKGDEWVSRVGRNSSWKSFAGRATAFSSGFPSAGTKTTLTSTLIPH